MPAANVSAEALIRKWRCAYQKAEPLLIRYSNEQRLHCATL